MEIFVSIAKAFSHEPFMWGILVVMIVGLTITIERARYITGAASVNKDELIARVNQACLSGNLEKALGVCSQVSSPLTNIIKAGLLAVANRRDAEEIQTAMDAVALKEIPRLEKRISLLALMSNLSTLIGLLGTIAGLIGAFSAVADVSPSEKATMLAKSIALAMNCTAFGLLVAIPLLAIYGWLQTKSQEVVDDVHEAAVATLNFIISNRDKFAR